MSLTPAQLAARRGRKQRRSFAGAMNPAYRPIQERFDEKVSRTDGCWNWVGARNANGYGSFRSDGRSRTVSRVAYELAHGVKLESSTHVLHKCDNPLCVRPDHLFLGNNDANVRDRVSKGRSGGAAGERNCKAKLTANDAKFIRESSLGTCALAKQYGVNRETVGRIRRGIRWSSV